MRSAQSGRSAPQLAVPARSPRGRIFSHLAAVAGLKPDPTGFRMPAEWEPHEPTWLAWPHERTDWPGKFSAIPWIYGEIARTLANVEKLRILVEDVAAEKAGRQVFKKYAVNIHAVEFFR